MKALRSRKKGKTETDATQGRKRKNKKRICFTEESIENIQNLLSHIMQTNLGKHLRMTYTLFGMTRQTQYSAQATGHLDTDRKGGKYLIIYPFSKTKEWHMLDFDTRRKLMGGHVGIGKKHLDKISQLLLYSFGIDDSEFIVSYETDDLSAFQNLVMELRGDKVREYTLKDTPIFTCIYKKPAEVLNFL